MRQLVGMALKDSALKNEPPEMQVLGSTAVQVTGALSPQCDSRWPCKSIAETKGRRARRDASWK